MTRLGLLAIVVIVCGGVVQAAEDEGDGEDLDAAWLALRESVQDMQKRREQEEPQQPQEKKEGEGLI